MQELDSLGYKRAEGDNLGTKMDILLNGNINIYIKNACQFQMYV